jgi:hypothetical protein
MIRRPLVGATVLCGALLLAACNGSPEAGRVTRGPTTTPTATPTATTPSAPSEEEAKAIASARTRYVIAQAAVVKALSDPRKASRASLESGGNGGQWLTDVLNQVVFQRDRDLYQTGSAKVVSTTVGPVRLQLEQPEVTLTNCVDGSGVVLRYRANGKPVPMGPGDGTRHRVTSRIVLAAGPDTKMWILVGEKVLGSC